MLYNIGGLRLFFDGRNKYLETRCVEFQEDDVKMRQNEPDMHVSMEFFDNIEKPVAIEIMHDKDMAFYKKNPPAQGYYIYLNNDINDGRKFRNPVIIDSNLIWSDIILKYTLKDISNPLNSSDLPIELIESNAYALMGLAYRNLLILKNGLEIHSSSIEYEGRGIIFSAPSGTGKSTHVRLWKELYGDQITIINEDRPAIRYFDDTPMICGIPWCGTSDNFVNKIVPLNYIVMLEQAPSNEIEQLDPSDALKMLFPRCFLPYFDSELMGKAIGILERIIKDIPVFKLKCLPDYNAVELVRKCLS